MIESRLETLFRDGIRRIGGRTEKLIPSSAGMPDRLVLLPGGRIYLVELKTETGKTSPIQDLWHMRAAELGTQVVVLHGVQEVRNWIARQELDLPDSEYSPVDNAIHTLSARAALLNDTQRTRLRRLAR